MVFVYCALHTETPLMTLLIVLQYGVSDCGYSVASVILDIVLHQ